MRVWLGGANLESEQQDCGLQGNILLNGEISEAGNNSFAGGTTPQVFAQFSSWDLMKSAVELGKEAQPNENAGNQLTQDEIQLITWRLQDRHGTCCYFSDFLGLFHEKRWINSKLPVVMKKR